MKNKSRRIKGVWLMWLVMIGLALPALPARADAGFSDVDPQKNSWAVGSIYLMAQKQVLTGYPDGTFRPNQTISKAEWTAMIYRLFDKYRPNLYATGLQKIDGFADVSPEHWAYKPISEIYSHSFNWGVYGLSNMGQLTFRPDMQLTRLQLADMLYSFFDTRLIDRRMSPNDICSVVSDFKDISYKMYADKNQYEDAAKTDGRYDAAGSAATLAGEVLPVLFLGTGKSDCSFGTDAFSNAQASSLASLQASGIMTANELGYFRPLDKVTRAEAVTILNRIYNYLSKNYWLGDYTTIQLDQTGAGSSGGSAGSGGGGSGSSGVYNPDTSSYYPDWQDTGGDISGSWSNDSIVNVTDYFDDKGVLTKNLQNGEIEAAVQPKENRYLTVDLKSQDKVDLYLILDGKIAFLKQEELPKTIELDGIKLVGFRTLQRNPNPMRVGGTTATLTVKLSVDKPDTSKPGKKK
ncbi:S-layer homology domain-containing protein [Paenibacillus doosanensis]|uniref:S-layer homology domain-containing protein n=1 Tax=Paenibacillus doosanensis TaxID=1229154 RepID=UPI00218034DE|nr:S-layer homology domain-containing protein [Paenibacillus doosanensis]MCS7464076.1 S-layer homology domain-containing protein [Paenibacillus doosanensis]